jgi:diketogulonate reductase-like aldo/keto reductase
VDAATTAIPTVDKRGAAIPRIGLGTWQLRGAACATIVQRALEVGYTHIDTAQGYANEAEVGEGMAASGVRRERVFITTKVQPQNMGAGDLQRSVEVSLRKLRVDRIDLLLLHWPNPAIPLSETIPAFNEVKRGGLVSHIGLSNFTIVLLDEAWRLTKEPFAAEQIELHPYLDQRKITAAIRARDMAVIAYCPIALGRAVTDPGIKRIADAHQRTPAQVALRWLLQQPDVVAIPKTAKVERLRENLDVFDFELSATEMAALSGMTQPNSRLVNEPQWVAQWD